MPSTISLFSRRWRRYGRLPAIAGLADATSKKRGELEKTRAFAAGSCVGARSGRSKASTYQRVKRSYQGPKLTPLWVTIESNLRRHFKPRRNCLEWPDSGD